MFVSVFTHACVRERDREKKMKIETVCKREREIECVCACACTHSKLVTNRDSIVSQKNDFSKKM